MAAPGKCPGLLRRSARWQLPQGRRRHKRWGAQSGQAQAGGHISASPASLRCRGRELRTPHCPAESNTAAPGALGPAVAHQIRGPARKVLVSKWPGTLGSPCTAGASDLCHRGPSSTTHVPPPGPEICCPGAPCGSLWGQGRRFPLSCMKQLVYPEVRVPHIPEVTARNARFTRASAQPSH